MFKRIVKRDIFPEPNPLFSYGAGKAQVHHARIRMGLSPLNQHRHKYNYIQDASCSICGHRQEDAMHYFLECPMYQGARNYLLQSVSQIVQIIIPNVGLNMSNREKKSLIEMFINGDSRLNSSQNEELFLHVQAYITRTARMK